MAKQALALKYRPSTFDDLCAQETIKTILTEQINSGTFQHVYLMCGPAGCGKTTSARIFANMINKGKGNPIEVDGASNSGVDNIRTIIEDAKKKSLDSEYKIYIIDECHQLSVSAWNAFLKLLEEPPKYTIFLLCTTDPQKIIPTILSRVQRYDFTKIPYDVIFDRLVYICNEEDVEYEEEALSYIAKLSGGGMRDAISKLDKCISLSNNVTIENVVDALGVVDYDVMFKLLEKLDLNLIGETIEIIENVYNSGKDVKQFCKDFLKFIVDVCKYKLFNNFTYIQIPKLDKYEQILKKVDKDNCFKILNTFKDITTVIKYDTDVKFTVESVLLSM